MKSVEFKKYEEYKNFESELFDKIPSHWEIFPNRHIFKLKKIQVGKKSNEYDLLSLTLKGIIKRDMENPEGKFPADFDTYQEVKKGDFVFCLFDVEETPRTVGLSNYDGMITGAYTVFESSNKFDKNYLYYFYLNLDLNKRLKMLYKGLRNTISKDNFFSFKTFVPPLEEQIAIANFLDEKCNKIDKAIAQKEKLIELLNERKQVIIQNSVTKGLNPEVEMKESEIGWIGKIPKQWEVTRLGTRFIERRRKVSDKDFSPLSVTKNGVVPQLETAVKTNDGDNRKLVKKGDFVINSRSDRKGSSGIAKKDGSVSLINIVLKPREIYPEFCNYLLKCNSFKEEFYRMGHGIVADLWTTRYDEMKNIKIMIPNFCEQISIVNFIEKECQKIDNAIVLQEKQLQKLKEYRAILIDNAVTGKIKVGD